MRVGMSPDDDGMAGASPQSQAASGFALSPRGDGCLRACAREHNIHAACGVAGKMVNNEQTGLSWKLCPILLH